MNDPVKGITILGANVTGCIALELPGPIQFMTAAIIVTSFDEVRSSKPGIFTTEVLNPRMEVLGSEMGEITPSVEKTELLAQGWEQRTLHAFARVFTATETGVHVIRLSLDDGDPWTLPYRITGG